MRVVNQNRLLHLYENLFDYRRFVFYFLFLSHIYCYTARSSYFNWVGLVAVKNLISSLIWFSASVFSQFEYGQQQQHKKKSGSVQLLNGTYWIGNGNITDIPKMCA